MQGAAWGFIAKEACCTIVQPHAKKIFGQNPTLQGDSYLCVALGRGIGGLEADFYLGWATFVKKNTGETTQKRIFSKPYSGVAARRRFNSCASVNKLPLKLAIVLKKNTV